MPYDTLRLVPRDQLADVCLAIMSAAAEQIAGECATLPHTDLELATIERSAAYRHGCEDVACFAISILFAQITGASMGVHDWPGVVEFHAEIERYCKAQDQFRGEHAAAIVADAMIRARPW
jgi:hypothetical protein